jgi:ABC-2 type transport system permease protein
MLALAAVGMKQGPLARHVLVLVAFAVGFLLLAARRLRRHG